MHKYNSKLNISLVAALISITFVEPVFGIVVFNGSDDVVKVTVKGFDNNYQKIKDNFQLGPRKKKEITNITICNYSTGCSIEVENLKATRKGKTVVNERGITSLYQIFPSQRYKAFYDIK